MNGLLVAIWLLLCVNTGCVVGIVVYLLNKGG